jgi:hypothetical protein
MTDSGPPDLDSLLASWAHTQRLSDVEAEQIRQAILPVVPTLSPTWWSDFNAKLSTAIARATTSLVPALAALS